jgi:hypothetical protein
MTVEGKVGFANIRRIDVHGKAFVFVHGHADVAGTVEFNIDPRDERSQQHAASRLQRQLDGYRGTQGDVADYLRAIQTLAD